MNYQEVISYIMNQLPMFQRIGKAAYRTGLDNTLKLDHYFNHPHRNFKTIHVAGTNGKGSVSHMLASVLQEAGYKAGLYTSPHLVDFRERIRVNGKMITKTFVKEFIEKHRAFFETFDPSFFEISVFMAFEYFRECNVDVAVIEVGLGGRLDATNVISPLLSVITNIGMDHTDILGDTLEKIAIEKAGIIKPETPVIIGETQPETLPVFNRISSDLRSPVNVADQVYKIDYSMKSVEGCQVFHVRKNGTLYYQDLKCCLLGHYQRKNAATVLASVDVLNQEFSISRENVYQGLRNIIKNTALAGRWQLIRTDPTVICDTAHNTEGIAAVLQQVNETPYRNLHMIIGFVNDKDIGKVMKMMPVNARYYFTRLSVPRTLDESVLAGIAHEHALKGKSFSNVREAYKHALSSAGRDDLVMITGSNFLVGDLLRVINSHLASPSLMTE